MDNGNYANASSKLIKEAPPKHGYINMLDRWHIFQAILQNFPHELRNIDKLPCLKTSIYSSFLAAATVTVFSTIITGKFSILYH